MSAADASEMSAVLAGRGFSLTRDIDSADALILSTCTVRQHAEDRALSLIGSLRPWKESRPERVLIVAGCAAERLGGWLQRRFPYVDLVVGAKSIGEFPALVSQALGARFDALREDALAFDAEAPEPSPVVALVTIMRGCNYSCSYCIVPAVRGRESYRPVSDILDEIRRKVEAGAREVLLLGQTVNSYDQTHEGRRARFPDLLRLVDRIDGLWRARFMSPHPRYLDDALCAAMAECPTVCESMHLPAQSGSDRVLKLMRRNYTAGEFLRRADRLRAAVPKIVFSTDIIVGFPTETESEFESTLSLLDALGPASAYCFKFSPREGTEAAGRPDDVPSQVKDERLARLNARVDALISAGLKSQQGTTVEVLTEAAGFGRARNGFKVRLDRAVPAGSLVSARITGMTRLTLQGETL